MTPAVGAAVVAISGLAAAVCAWPPAARAGDRLRGLPAPGDAPPAPPTIRTALLVAAGLGGVVALLVGLPWWLAVAVVGLLAARRWSGSRHADELGELALVTDLLAAGLGAGATVLDALRAARTGAGPVLTRRVDEVVVALAAGEPPERAWAGWLADPRLAPIARTCVRTSGSGAGAAAELVRAAARIRSRRRSRARERVERTSVLVVLPLGLCFLPAFVLVGVVPIALGLFGHWR